MTPFLTRVFALSFLGPTLTTLIALGFLMYLGTFTRHWADDFCYIATIENIDNVFKSTQLSYMTWSNRYSNVLLVSIVNFFGRSSVRFFPTTMIVLMSCSLFLLITQLSYYYKHRISALIWINFALLLTFISVLGAPNRFQSVYWMIGLITYFAPLILIIVITAFILWAIRSQAHKSTRGVMLMLVAVLVFFAGGLSETTLTLQISFFFLFFFVCSVFLHSKQRNTGLLFTGVAFVASLVALLVVLMSPGNYVRLDNIPKSDFSLVMVPLIFRFAWDFIWNTTRALIIPSCFAFLSTFVLAFAAFLRQKPLNYPRYIWLFILFIPPITYILIASMFAPSVYVYGRFGYPEPRALFPAQFILSAALMSLGFLSGWFVMNILKRWLNLRISLGMIMTTIMLLVIAAYPLWFLKKEIQIAAQFERYAQQWDERDSYLIEQQQQGTLDVALHGIQPPGGLLELRQDPNFWVNKCVADFYRLNSIAVFP
jgi:hypothetical protein